MNDGSPRKSQIILLNGTSSAGKTTLARALRPALAPEFHFYSSDQLADASMRPAPSLAREETRPLFFDGFQRSIAAFASAGLNLLVEHIVEEQSWADDLDRLLAPFDTFWVGVHAPVEEIQRREAMRGDRHPGEALFHLKTHTFHRYDVEVNTTRPEQENILTILTAWSGRSSVSKPKSD